MDNRENKNSSITFTEKKRKSRVKQGIKYTLFAFFIVLLFVNIFFDYKHNSIMNNSMYGKDTLTIDYIKIADTVAPSLVSILEKDSIDMEQEDKYTKKSTGIILDESGTILTTYSSIYKKDNIYVRLSYPGIEPIKAEFIGGVEEADIALIKISYNEPLQPIKLANFNELTVGEDIAILSNPTNGGYIDNINPGIVTSIEKVENEKKYELIQISGHVSEFNDGGAICNSKGEVVAMASNKITSQKNQPNIYYSIGLGELEEIINISVSFKNALGLIGGSIVKDEKLNISGYYVQGVKKNGLAYKSGIEPTDIIIAIDGYDITHLQDIEKIIKNKRSGDEVNLQVINDGNIKEIQIKF